MQIIVEKTGFLFNKDFPKIKVAVSFYDNTAKYHNNACVSVFLEKKDYTISELKTLAIQEAKKYLETVMASELEEL